MFITQQQRRRKMRMMVLMVAGLSLLMIATLIFSISASPPSSASLTPEEVVNQFYQAEQSGDFGSSWELLHPLMQEKFTKQEYIGQRSRLLMQDFGVNRFDFKLGMSSVEPIWNSFSNVTKIPVTMMYHSRFGDLEIQQDVYVVKEKDSYRVLWSYSEQK